MKDYLLVNWDDYNDKSKGGVQSVFKNVGGLLNDKFNVRQVSFGQSVKCIDPRREKYYVDSEVHKSLVIDRYLEHYFSLWNDLVHGMVRNAGCGGLTDFSEKIRIVNVFHDPYHSIYETLIGAGFTGNKDELWRFRRTAVWLQKLCGQQGVNVAVSDFMKQDMHDNGIKCDVVIPNGVDWSFWKPMIDFPKIYMGGEKYRGVGLWVGSIHAIKNYHSIARLVHDFPDIFWVLVVKGSVDGFVDRPKKTNFVLYNDISPELLRALYMNADFVVCASSVESFNLVALQSALMNKPIITSKTGLFWNNNYWSNKLGVRLLDCFDYPALKNAVNDVLSKVSGPPFSPREHIIAFPELGIKKWGESMKKVLNY